MDKFIDRFCMVVIVLGLCALTWQFVLAMLEMKWWVF